jgi:hypothetical protein
MLSEAEIFDRYCVVGTLRGCEIYLKIPEALNFIKDCQINELAIIGVEGFLLRDGQLHPQIDIIVDYSSLNVSSWQEYVVTCNQSTQGVLSEFRDRQDLVINFVLLAEEQWLK